MRYLVVLCDGAADLPNEALGGKTPFECARKPHIDALAKCGEVGLCRTVAPGLKPGSDVANLSVLGYDPAVCYTGRSPLEAASIGVDLQPTDVALRCNLVTLSDDEPYREKTMVDYCAGDISTAEAAQLIEAVQAALGSKTYHFYAGVAYRHCLVVANGTIDLGKMTPPHDISDRVITPYLSDSPNAAPLLDLMEQSWNVLRDHPVNAARRARGLRPANSIWLWGEGVRPKLTPFCEKYGVKGGIVSAVDLLKGIGICAGMQTPDVPGATGYLDTNFKGKAEAAVRLFETGCDLVYVHLEAPDECGHRGEAQNKVAAIERIDGEIVAPLVDYLRARGDFRLLLLPDHPTPLSTRTHSGDPVPYLLYDSRVSLPGVESLNEKTAAATGQRIEHGPDVMSRLLEKTVD